MLKKPTNKNKIKLMLFADISISFIYNEEQESTQLTSVKKIIKKQNKMKQNTVAY